MKYFKLTLFVFILSFLGTACDIEGEDNRSCYAVGYVAATAVTGPTEVAVNDPIIFNVTFKVNNSCGDFVLFDETNGFPKHVGTKVAYTGCECDDVERTLTKEYKFTPTRDGQYEFKFLSGEDQYITKTVTVTE